MELLHAIVDLLAALYQVVVALLASIAPLTPLLVWVAYWTLAVDWVKLRHFFLRGGWIVVLLLMFTAILTWGVIAPPESGTHSLLGLTLGNFVGKTVYVTAIVVITLLCGSVQLSGICGPLVRLQSDEQEPTAHAR